MNMPCHLFMGPSGFGLNIEIGLYPDVIWHEPVKRGDVERLIAGEPQAAIAIADGTFHRYPAVSHIEIRDALDDGWQVWGLCSMGAIRACEMSSFGMRGFGAVYQTFQNDLSYPDDEVALLHSSEAPFLPISEPLIHLRGYIRTLRARGILTEGQADELVQWLQQRWYGERSFRATLDWVGLHCDEACRQGALLVADDAAPFRLKQKDLQAFLEQAPWRNNGSRQRFQ